SNLFSSIVSYLLEPAIRSLLLAGLLAVVFAVLRVKSLSLRLTLWTGVLYAALAMPPLGWLLPALPLFLPKIEIWRLVSVSAPVAHVGVAARTSDVRSASVEAAHSLLATPSDLRSSHTVPWKAILAMIYTAGALLLLARFVLGFLLSRRLTRSSNPIKDADACARLRWYALLAGIEHLPRFNESEAVSVPATLGVFRPTIVLPEGWRKWEGAKVDAVLAHEVSHVARRDALTQQLSLLHRSVFWFSPLSWWLNRQLAELAEQASDEAALHAGADRTLYAETLLGFFAVVKSAPGRVRWQGISIANGSHAERRVERILSWKGGASIRLTKPVIVVVLLFATPVLFLTAAVRPLTQQLPPLPAPPPSPALPVAALKAPVLPRAPAPPPAQAGAPVAPAPPEPADADESSTWMDDSDGPHFVIMSGQSHTMSGSSDDWRHAKSLRSRIKGDFIWFERDDKGYVITDSTTVSRAREFFAPQEELGRKQAELGAKQAELGEQQAALGKKMSEVRVKVPDLTTDLRRVAERLKELGPTASQEDLGRIQSEIGELQSKIGEIQSRAGKEQSRIGEEQGAVGEKQGELGRQQGELGRQQAKAAKEASRKMQELLN
ncbi:MAG TPA: M56 family metallopeptidase, partial [Candidatus Methylomirabilis sp.]|nr:M56 family metallopeptidase [Candidatus Methylomirabilis sp.]